MKKRFRAILLLLITVLMCVYGAEAKAESSYLSEDDARLFLAFVYNSKTEVVTKEALKDDIYYKMLTGAYSNDSTYELAAKAAFLSFMDARIIQTLENANVAVKTSRDYLLEFFSKKIDDEATELVTDIYKENVAGSILNLCGGDEVLPMLDSITSVVENPTKYLDNVKAISSALAYTYGQNVVSLYTYFDSAVSNMYLKKTEGAYETAMSYNIMALKESNFMSTAANLIPSIPSWEDWVDKMDYWAEFVYNMRGEVSAGNTRDFCVVVYHPNCDELEAKILWYTDGPLYAPVMEREGYLLEGWYFDADCTIGPVTGSYVPTDHVTLYAKWIDRYLTIHFDSNCAEVSDYTYEIDRLNVDWHVPDMKRPGYIFRGWYWDSACKNPASGEIEITGDMTFYAGWRTMFTYTVSGGKATLTYISEWEKDENGKNITDIIIPEKIGGYPVETVDVQNWARSITGITFSDSVTSVKEWSFSWFSSLKNVVLGDGITVIEEGAFARSPKIEKVVFGTGLKTIEDDAFISCSMLSEMSLPEGLVSIGANAFSECAISELTIPDSVTTIGKCAFSYCSALKNVAIGKGVTNVDGETFKNCNVLESISVSGDNRNFASVDGVLYSKDKTVLYKYPSAKTGTSFKVPETVTEIADYAFLGCVNLENIDISNVKTIGASAFYDCKKLKSIDISKVNSLGENAFYGCESLNTVTMPNELEEIRYGTFYGCISLGNVVIPQSVKSIAMEAFGSCESLTEITVPEGVTYIGDYAFHGCTKLSKVKLPSQLTDISSGLFGSCESLEQIEIPKTVISIGSLAFYNCSKLNNIDIPDTVTFIGSEAFENCIALRKIVIPEGVTNIYYYTFYGCEALEKIVIPASVTCIDFSNFESTSKLREVYFMGTEEAWDAVYIDEYGNEYLNDADVVCDFKAVAEISDVIFADNKISGKVLYDVVLEDTDVLVSLFDGDTFVGVKIKSAKKGDENTDFSFTVTGTGDYNVKAFFWDYSDLTPKGMMAAADV